MSIKINSQKGFTLIEMIVSIALFIVVAVVAIGALLKVISTDKKSQSLKTSINNINYVLESMTREMRVGINYKCEAGSGDTIPTTASCGSGVIGVPNGWTVSFDSAKTYPINANTNCRLKYAYQFDGTTINKAEQYNCDDWNEFAPVISPDMHFTTANVKSVVSTDAQSYNQFHFVGYTGVKEKDRTYFDLQTTVSQRLSD